MPKAKEPTKGKRRRGLDPDYEVDEVSGLEAYNFSDEVDEKLERIGVVRKDRPRITEDHIPVLDLEIGSYFDGRMPVVIKHLTLDQLSVLYSLLDNWYDYLTYQTRKAFTECAEAKKQREFIKSLIRQQNNVDDEGRKIESPIKTDITNCDRRFVEANAKFTSLDCFSTTLEAMLKIADHNMKLVSREVTIKIAQMEHGGIGGRLRNRGNWKPRTNRRHEDDHEEEESDAPKKRSRKTVRRAGTSKKRKTRRSRS